MKKSILLIFYLSMPLCIFAQYKNLTFTRINVENSLLANNVNVICQDSNGYMWFGTENGLSRYDGYDLISYTHNPADSFSISDNFIYDILEDTIKGNLWVATRNGGLNYYDCSVDRFKKIDFSGLRASESKSQRVQCLLFDPSKCLWAGTFGGLICLSKTPELFINNNQKKRDYNNKIRDIEYWKDNKFWLCTQDGLYIFDAINRTFTERSKGLFFEVIKDQKKNFWFATITNGVCKLDINNILSYYSKQNKKLRGNHINAIAEDKHGNIWISQRDFGVSILCPDSDSTCFIQKDLHKPEGLHSNVITEIYVDKDKNIWLGSYDAGIVMHDNYKKPFTHYKYNFLLNGVRNNNIRSMYQDSEGDIWIGTRVNGCLSLFNKESGFFNHFPPVKNDPNSLNDDYVLCITEHKPGYLWLGTFKGGLELFNKKTGQFTHHLNIPGNKNSISSNAIYALCKDSKKRLWVGTGWQGIDVFDENMNKLFRFKMKMEDKSTLVSDEVRYIYEDSHNTVWIGTEDGLCRYNENQDSFTRYISMKNNDKSLSNNRISCIYEDSNNRFWISTRGGGLNLFNREKEIFRTYREIDGLSSNYVLGIVEDKNTNLWLSTYNGVSKFIIGDNRNSVPEPNFRNYDSRDGLQGNEFALNAHLKTTDGEILFGGNNGFNIFIPEKIVDNPLIPTIHFAKFKLFNKTVKIGGKSSPLIKHINNCKHIYLHHYQSVFSIDYVAINYSSPEKKQFAYILQGLESDWNYVGTKRSATYSNLNPGEYIFKVKASNNDGVWNEQGKQIKITVLPPWWKTIWFTVLYTSILLAVVFYIIRRRFQILKEQKVKLERIVAKRTHELNEMNHMLSERKEELEVQMHDMAKMNKEIKAKSEQVSKMAQKLHEADETKLRFFTNISHEFRTPLTLIVGPIKKLLNSGSTPDKNNLDIYLKIMLSNANRLLRLINQLIDLRVLEKGAKKLDFSNNNIIEFVKEIATAFSPMAEAKRIQLLVKNEELRVKSEEQHTQKFPSSLITHHSSLITQFWFDPSIMEKILYNLISNAIKYTPEGGKILIAVGVGVETQCIASLQNQLAIKITDTGIGIKPEILTKIFDRFYRVETRHGASRPEGTGIGLAYTKELVNIHKGEIHVKSEYGKGAVFELKFPIVKMENNVNHPKKDAFKFKYTKSLIESYSEGEKKTSKTTTENEAREAENIEKKHLLVVDDNPDIRFLIRDELKNKFNIYEAEDGVEGWEKALEHSPDLIISDIMMPEMDGIDFCKKLRGEEFTSHIPVILLTAKSGEADQVRGLQTGAVDYITKPFSMDILKAKIDSLFYLRKQMQQKFSQTVDVDTKIVTHSDLDDEFLKKAIAIVYDNLQNNSFNNDLFIEQMFCSRTLVYRKIKSLTGLSLSDFIRNVRLKEAVKLFKAGNNSIADVCFAVGFKHQTTLTHYFKKMYDKTPTQFLDELNK